MPKVNYTRGETREFIWRRDLGSRHRNREHRGRGGLIHDYRELFEDVALRNWCPCCISILWRRNARGGRAECRRIVHRALRRAGKRLCREWVQE